MPLLIFIYSMMGRLTCKYEPFWQEVTLGSLLLRWPLRPVGHLFVKHCQFHSTVRQINIYVKGLFKLVFDFCVTNQKCLKVKRVTMKNNYVVERHGTQRQLRHVTMPFKLYMMIKWTIINVSSLNFHNWLNNCCFIFSTKIYMHCLISIDFIVSVYELFTNPSYVRMHNKLIMINIQCVINNENKYMYIKRQDTH